MQAFILISSLWSTRVLFLQRFLLELQLLQQVVASTPLRLLLAVAVDHLDRGWGRSESLVLSPPHLLFNQRGEDLSLSPRYRYLTTRKSIFAIIKDLLRFPTNLVELVAIFDIRWALVIKWGFHAF